MPENAINKNNISMMNHLFRNSSLDKIDIKILDVLRDDARIQLKGLASRCRISKQTALYRMNRMQKDGIIKGFHAKINYSMLGYSTYYIFIQTRYIEDEKRFIEDLSKIKGCIVVMKSITQYSYNLKVITKDVYGMTQELEGFFNKKKNVTSHFILQRLEKSPDKIEEEIKVDEKDRKILQEISINCRLSSLEISKKTGLSYDIVHNRLKGMIKNRIIEKFQAIINFELEGFMYYSILLKFADDQLERLALFDSNLKMDPLIVERFKCLGEFGYIFEIVDKDYVAINDKLNRIKSQFYELIRSSQIVPIQSHYFYKVRLE